MFPIIHDINDILPHIAGKEEFIVAVRDWGHVINYMVQSPDTWGDPKDPSYAFRRECRGIKFDQTGKIIARPLHKFWNLNERDETQIKNIDMNQLHVVLSKVDGSMVHPIVTDNGDIVWMTKMGITEVANLVPKYINSLPYDKAVQLRRFIHECHQTNNTPIFEFCSRQSRVVIDHPKDKLILLAIRHMHVGEYVPYYVMQEIAIAAGLKFVPLELIRIDNLQKFQHDSLALEGIEGFVIRFNSGEMIKQKTDWYLVIHRAKDAIMHEKNVIAMLLDENLDDIKANLLDDDRHRLEKFENTFKEELLSNINSIFVSYSMYYEGVKGDKKTFAIEIAPTLPSMVKSFMFAIWGDKTIERLTALVKETILKYTSSSTRVDQVRWLWNNCKYAYIENIE